MFDLKAFIEESNRIEGIVREATYEEIQATTAFLDKPRIVTSDLEDLVDVYAPGNRLRDAYGIDVTVGGFLQPRGSPAIRTALDTLLTRVSDKDERYTPWQTHMAFLLLHPFTDGNGRGGRALWLWQMRTAPLGFLHKFYYQTLAKCEGDRRG